MKQHFTILILVYILTFSLRGQTIQTSKLFDSNGRLYVDTTLKISKEQLTRWISIEDTLTKKILIRLHYPQILLENEITGKLIISFTVDIYGVFNDFRIEKYYSLMSKDKLEMDIKMFAETCFGSTVYFSGDFIKLGFKSDKNEKERYYLPFEFKIISDKTRKTIKNSYLTFECEEYKISK
jgi:hypothetical protein